MDCGLDSYSLRNFMKMGKDAAGISFMEPGIYIHNILNMERRDNHQFDG